MQFELFAREHDIASKGLLYSVRPANAHLVVVENEIFRLAAQVNTIGNSKPVFDRMLENLFMDRTRDNEEIPKPVVNDQDARLQPLPDARCVQY